MPVWVDAVGRFAGGFGLFLLGMWLMTDGLKLAAGRALERILRSWTRTRLRGLCAAALITAVVQSSSAVTVAAIGFVNAGLLAFREAVWVLFGANVGTTITGWLVALVGLNFKIEALSLPLLGGGMLLRLAGGTTRAGALGTAIAGFGALFLGIDVLREAFTELAPNFGVPPLEDGALAAVMYVLIGVLLTTIMQSSSAALAVALTAAGGVPASTVSCRCSRWRRCSRSRVSRGAVSSRLSNPHDACLRRAAMREAQRPRHSTRAAMLRVVSE